jgi:Core-2/I-Branching enzyme
MAVAYLILAHQAPVHLGRLITSLESESSTVVVHLDRKSDPEEFMHLAGTNVRFTDERVDVQWGYFSQVEAILVLLRSGLADPRRFDRFVLLSGVDYPLRSAEYIEQFFEAHRDREFINLVEIPDESVGKPITRLTTYQPDPGTGPVSRRARDLVMRIGRRIYRRDYESRLDGRVPYGGSTWWALSREACECIVRFEASEPRVVDFFRHVICPDESFVHTIIGNSQFRDNAVRNLTYSDWAPGSANPSRITEAHLDRLLTVRALGPSAVAGTHEFLFARKFSDDDHELVADVDRLIGRDGRCGPGMPIGAPSAVRTEHG